MFTRQKKKAEIYVSIDCLGPALQPSRSTRWKCLIVSRKWEQKDIKTRENVPPHSMDSGTEGNNAKRHLWLNGTLQRSLKRPRWKSDIIWKRCRPISHTAVSVWNVMTAEIRQCGNAAAPANHAHGNRRNRKREKVWCRSSFSLRVRNKGILEDSSRRAQTLLAAEWQPGRKKRIFAPQKSCKIKLVSFLNPQNSSS